MQVGRFSTGGYYAHKVRLHDSPMRFSVWFNPDGSLSDAIAIDRLDRARPVTQRQRTHLEARFGYIKTYVDSNGLAPLFFWDPINQYELDRNAD